MSVCVIALFMKEKCSINESIKYRTYKSLHNVYVCIYKRTIGQMSRVFANGPGDQGSIPGRVIPKTKKMVLDAALLSTQHYKVRIKS